MSNESEGPDISAAKRYKRRMRELRAELVEAQYEIRKLEIPTIITVTGFDGGGKGEVVNLLNEWMDPRWIDTHAYWKFSDEEIERPYAWRFWTRLPARGRFGVLFGSWYADPIVRKTFRQINTKEWTRSLEHINYFEDMLALDGALIVKFWLHLSRSSHQARLPDLDRNPQFHWKLTPKDWNQKALYTRFSNAARSAMEATDHPSAPWHVIDAEDRNRRNLSIATELLEAFQSRLGRKRKGPAVRIPHETPPAAEENYLATVDLDQSLGKKRYEQELEVWQKRLSKAVWKAHRKKVASVLVFEGWDASGKGGCIRRIVHAMDARLFDVIPVSAPTDEEFAHHYLWRFWKNMPRDGTVSIFDRSWYGRVLVERVERLCSRNEWQRAYDEINEMETQLVEHGVVVCKFWLHISKDVQLERFKKREEIPFKRHKLCDDDWRNRKKWRSYERAINDMIENTSTDAAPWTLIPANNKKFARIEVLRHFCQRLELAVGTDSGRQRS